MSVLRRLPRVSPAAYRRITFAAALLLAVIIVTGGAVRLTGSGLGCPDWPNCDPGHLTPRSAADVNAMVEFLNRVFTALVSVAVGLAVVGALLRRPRRADLVWLSLGLVAGFVAQAVLGGLVVLFELQPQFVMAHFLLSLVLLANGILLHRRAGEPRGPARRRVAPVVRRAGAALLVAISVVAVTGTVVTASGPHGGDAKAKRFSYSIPQVARVHGSAVVVFLALTLVTFALLRRTRASADDQRRLGIVLLVAVAQAAIGYIQYFNGIPALLVGIHIAGATAVFAAVFHFWLHLTDHEPAAPPAVDVVEPALASA
ncbi:MAG TPA: COX15/CtaA family protein [Acidimicrobiia bacterium]|jgi:cytochrome c oxidase assembly protein subunit 15|nr:COX15/CtaA family protein [Acidimicrobiia bacterium]